MKKTLARPQDRYEIAARIHALTPADRAQWGRLTLDRMLIHLTDCYLYALGEKPAELHTSFLARTALKFLALESGLPWAKGFQTRPEFDPYLNGALPLAFELGRRNLFTALETFCTRLPQPPIPHPIFGAMSAANWYRWGYLHADHHLRQFGR